MKQYNCAVVGATGAVGNEMIKVLEQRRFPAAALAARAGFSFAAKIFNYLLGKWDSFLVVVMTPQEMFARGARSYEKLVPDFSDKEVISQGLSWWEQEALAKPPQDDLSILILAGGGGREAVACARMGYRVTSVDILPEMTKRAVENAARENIKADFITSDFLKIPEYLVNFDRCLLSHAMYSAIPAPDMRVKTLAGMLRALRGGGLAFIHYFFDPGRKTESLFKFRRFLARTLKGNYAYLPGDELISSRYFSRYFTDDTEIAKETAEAGFILKGIKNDGLYARYAVLQKP